MTEKRLKEILVAISGVDDFTLQLLPKHSTLYWGRYFAWRKIIRLYVLDENGNQYPDEILLREGTHELAHHMQFNHVEGWIYDPGVMHDSYFHDIHKAYLDKVFGRTVPVKYSSVMGKAVASRKSREEV